MIEYRLGWSAGSNASFRGTTDWEQWEDEDATAEDVEKELEAGSAIALGLEMVIEASGFGWWAEVREVANV